MVRLRLRRVGRKKQASFRIVAADKETKRDGRFLEAIGYYNPRTEPETIQVQEDRAYDWLSKGAQPSDSVARLFTTIGLYDRFERFKAGEDVAKLVEEAQAAEEARKTSPKTRRPAPVKNEKKAAANAEAAAAKAKEEEAAAKAAAEQAAAAEAEEPAAELEEAAPAAETAPAEAEAPAEEEAPADEEAPSEEAGEEDAKE